MIRLTNFDGRALLMAPSAIAKVTEAGPSQAWHGVRANVQCFDGSWTEVRETPDQIAAQMFPAPNA